MANHDETTDEQFAELETHIEAIKLRTLVTASLAENALATLARLRAEQARKDARLAELEAEVERLRAHGIDPDGEHGDQEEDDE